MDLEKVRKLLTQEKDRLHSERNAITDADSSESLIEEIGELSGYDNHPADAATATYDREIDQAFVDRLDMLAQKVDRALQKLDDGTYGTCDRCSKPIPVPRLQAMPSAALCLGCQDMEDSF